MLTYRHTTVIVPFPEDFSHENMKLVFMGVVQKILDNSGVRKPVTDRITVIEFLDAKGKPWLVDEDDPGLFVKTSDILNRRFDLLKRSLDLRTTHICHEHSIANLRRMEGIKEAGLPYPTSIKVSMPVALSYTQDISFARDIKTVLGKTNEMEKAEIF